jgi:hypothetical protein
MENKIEFILKIFNIPGKNTTQTYLNDIKIRLEKLSLKYKLEIISDNNDKLMGGALITFPYNYFENILNTVFKNEKIIEYNNIEETQYIFEDNISNIILIIYNVGNNYGNIGGLKQFEYWLAKQEINIQL